MTKDKNTAIADVDIGDVLGLGAAMAQPHQIDPRAAPYVALPPSWQVHDLEKFLALPVRPRGSIAFGDAGSFIRYVNKHKDTAGLASTAANMPPPGTSTSETAAAPKSPDPDDMQTIIVVDVLQSKFLAVFDHHASDAPGWAGFKASYDCPLSPQWKMWIANNGKEKAKEQEDFAFFIEQNMLDIVDPVGARMLEIVTTLKSAKNVSFDSAIRLQDGQVQIKYHEEGKTTAGASGQFAIPEQIKLGLPVYVGAPAYEVKANFRYRINGTKLWMWYDLVTPERILEDSLNKVIAEVEKGTGIKPYAVTSTSI